MIPIQPILKDIPILICRPEPSATELDNALSAMGAQCHKLPGLAIHSVTPTDAERQHILNLDQYTHVIALSQHAAVPALELIDEYWPQFPVQQSWFAIGRATANTLAQHVETLIQPEADLTSEDLLALPELADMNDSRVLILKGRNGRTVIEEALLKRGAKAVDNIELYERITPSYSDADIRSGLVEFKARYIIALSGETVKNIKTMANQIHCDLSEHHLIVPSERVAQVAMQQGFKLTYIPNNLKPIDIIRCIANIEGQIKRDSV